MEEEWPMAGWPGLGGASGWGHGTCPLRPGCWPCQLPGLRTERVPGTGFCGQRGRCSRGFQVAVAFGKWEKMSRPQFSELRALACTPRRQEGTLDSHSVSVGPHGVRPTGLRTVSVSSEQRPVELSRGGEAPSPGRLARPREPGRRTREETGRRKQRSSQSTPSSDSAPG